MKRSITADTSAEQAPKRLRSAVVVPQSSSIKPRQKVITTHPKKKTAVTTRPIRTILTTRAKHLVNCLLGHTLLEEEPIEIKLAAGTKLEKMRNEPAGIWEDPEVQKQLKRLEAFRASFQQGILADDLTEARLTVWCLTLETSLGNWSRDVETAIRTSKVGNRRGR